MEAKTKALKFWKITYINPIQEEAKIMKIASTEKDAIKLAEKTLKRKIKVLSVKAKEVFTWMN
jgi:tetraacyldisaccharide-1-P 4'-kinase